MNRHQSKRNSAAMLSRPSRFRTPQGAAERSAAGSEKTEKSLIHP
jgi:hypothetical protein